MSSIQFLNLKEIKELLKNNNISYKELHSETVNLFKKYNEKLNCALEIFEDSFIENSIPFIVKDVISQKNRKLSAGSKILSNFISPYDATVIERLNFFNYYSIGRANCDQFGMGSSGENSAFGPSINPWNLNKVPGGSSSGSASAVAAGLVPFSLGAETGGSVRQPACLCGIVGLKTTYGSISRNGAIAYASSIDQIGIFTRNIRDCAEIYFSIAGFDKKDSTTIQNFKSYSKEEIDNFCNQLNNFSCKGKKIGVIENAINAKDINLEVKKKLEEALNVYSKLGAEIEYVSMPTMEYSAAVYFVISRAEVASNLSRYDGVKYGYRSKHSDNLLNMYSNTRNEGFGDVAKNRIILGNYVLSSEYTDKYYIKAKEVQALMKDEFFNNLKKFDVLFLPTFSDIAFDIGEFSKNSIAIDLGDYFTAAANLVGIPGISIPCGFVKNLPVGFQLLGKMLGEKDLFNFGHAYEQATEWHKHKPSAFMI